MQYCLHKNENDKSRLTIFFNGWGMGSVGGIPNFLTCWQGIMAKTGFDKKFKGELLEIFDYTEPGIDVDLAELTSKYEQVFVLAWSLGVWACVELMSEYDISILQAVAVNGTLEPISESYGLSPEIFQATIDNWTSQTARTSFNRRMGRKREKIALFEKIQMQRTLAQQKEELIALVKRIRANNITNNQIFDLAVIGSQDRIFLPERQEKYWNKHNVEIIQLDIAHWPGGDS